MTPTQRIATQIVNYRLLLDAEQPVTDEGKFLKQQFTRALNELADECAKAESK